MGVSEGLAKVDVGVRKGQVAVDVGVSEVRLRLM